MVRLCSLWLRVNIHPSVHRLGRHPLGAARGVDVHMQPRKASSQQCMQWVHAEFALVRSDSASVRAGNVFSRFGLLAPPQTS
jgi:hypothetical protein